MTIFLIGSMGVGKSSLGKMIAQDLGVFFLDTDDEIVDHECKSINSIFSDHGEPYFRALESKVLRGLDSTKAQVIATGGGMPIPNGNMDYMLENGVVVYLESDIETLTNRLFRSRYNRPAIKLLDIDELRHKLTKVLEKRQPIYEQAHLIYKRQRALKEEAFELSRYLKMFI